MSYFQLEDTNYSCVHRCLTGKSSLAKQSQAANTDRMRRFLTLEVEVGLVLCMYAGQCFQQQSEVQANRVDKSVDRTRVCRIKPKEKLRYEGSQAKNDHSTSEVRKLST